MEIEETKLLQHKKLSKNQDQFGQAINQYKDISHVGSYTDIQQSCSDLIEDSKVWNDNNRKNFYEKEVLNQICKNNQRDIDRVCKKEKNQYHIKSRRNEIKKILKMNVN